MMNEQSNLSDKALNNITGGSLTMPGYAPGDKCPDCGAVLEDNYRQHGDYRESICPKCMEVWFYTIPK